MNHAYLPPQMLLCGTVTATASHTTAEPINAATSTTIAITLLHPAHCITLLHGLQYSQIFSMGKTTKQYIFCKKLNTEEQI
jgi:hypothetical protein